MSHSHLLLALFATTSLACSYDAQFSPVTVVGVEPVLDVSAGGEHTCAALRNGNSGCWGNNTSGQLGVELTAADGSSRTSTSIPTYVPLPSDPIAVVAGGLATCALFEESDVACFGTNQFGELGIPTECSDANSSACAPIDPTFVPGITGVVGLSVGGPSRPEQGELGETLATAFVCALMENGSAQCWGSNRFGQAGPGRLLKESPEPVVDSNGFPLRDIVDIATGDRHTCVVEAAGTVRCFGDNQQGQLGPVDESGRVLGLVGVVDVDAGSEHTCAATDTGDVFCWGQNFADQAGNSSGADFCEDTGLCVFEPQRIEGVRTAISVSLGDRHSCALGEFGEVWCWGGNQDGQLGVTGRALSAPAIAVPVGESVAVSAGKAHTCALAGDGSLSCWGRNRDGQVGVPRE